MSRDSRSNSRSRDSRDRSQDRDSNATKVYVGNLPSNTRTRDLEESFSRFGRVRRVELKNRYAFVGYYNKRDAEDSIREMDGKDFEGNKLIVEWTKGQPRGRSSRKRDDSQSSVRRKVPPERSDYRVVVSNVPEKCHWTELKDKFRDAGTVVFGDVWGSRGVVEFKYKEDMKNAIRKFNKSTWKGFTLRVEQDRRRMGSHSRSRERSRSSRSSSRTPSRSRSRRSRSRSRSRRSRSRSRSPSRSRHRRSHKSRKSRSRSRSRSRSGRKSRRKSRRSRRERSKESRDRANGSKGRESVNSERRSPSPDPGASEKVDEEEKKIPENLGRKSVKKRSRSTSQDKNEKKHRSSSRSLSPSNIKGENQSRDEKDINGM